MLLLICFLIKKKNPVLKRILYLIISVSIYK